MRRFILGWKVLGYARHFKAEIVNYVDDLAVLGRAPAAVMLAAVEVLMKRLKLAMNVEKTRCCRVPEESMTFLGYRIGCNYRLETGAAYIGTRPSRESVQSICRRVSELTAPRHVLLPPGVVVGRLGHDASRLGPTLRLIAEALVGRNANGVLHSAFLRRLALLHDSTAARVGALFQLLVQGTTAQDFGLPSSAIRLRM